MSKGLVLGGAVGAALGTGGQVYAGPHLRHTWPIIAFGPAGSEWVLWPATDGKLPQYNPGYPGGGTRDSGGTVVGTQT